MAERHVTAELVPLRGGEMALFSGCAESDLYIPIARRLHSGLVLAIDRFDFYIGGNLVEWRSASLVLNKVWRSDAAHNIVVANMVLYYLNCQNKAFDIVVSSTFDTSVRGYKVPKGSERNQKGPKAEWSGNSLRWKSIS